MTGLFSFVLAALAVFFPVHIQAQKRAFAHVIVGDTFSYSQAQWASDITLAHQAGIDGFVLNIAPPFDGNTATQVSFAFLATNNFLNTNQFTFKLFFSFDYEGGGQPWAAGDVITVLQAYAANGATAQYNGKPIVSTFAGVDHASDWDSIRASVPGGIFFIPNWNGNGPDSVTANLNRIDGFFPWEMWPKVGDSGITTNPDTFWKGIIGSSKAYMMGVSPWFYTDLPKFGKQFLYRGDSLWFDRWQEVFQIQPDLVEIVTWNDFGESHYIGPIFEAGIPQDPNGGDARRYVDNMPHDHWRDLLPYYIAKYKGLPAPTTPEKFSYWYRLSPAAAGNTDGVVCGATFDTQQIPAAQCETDSVYVTALVNALPATITVKIGNNAARSVAATTVGANLVSVPYNGQTGAVTVQLIRSGGGVISSTGPIIASQPNGGIANFNAWVGGASA